MNDSSLLLWVEQGVASQVNPSLDSRNNAYELVVLSGCADDQRTQLYQYLLRHPQQSFNDLQRRTRLRLSSITARINELRKNGLVILDGYKVDEVTGIRNCTWTAIRGDE